MSYLNIVVTSDESVRYEIDGVTLIETDHDLYGWEGMEAVDKALRMYATITAMNIKVDETIEKMPI